MDFGKNTRRNMVAGTAFLVASLAASLVNADACDYRPSQLIGGGGAAGTAVGAGTVAAAGTAAKAAGYYTLVHSTSGAYMLGSTAAGASAAGTAGIVAGTGTGLGAVAAFVTAPAVIIGAVVAAVGTGAFEGVCYFADERITRFDQVAARLKVLADANPKFVTLYSWGENPKLVLKTPKGTVTYSLYDLYIVNGVLMHRDWGFNTEIGTLAYIIPTEKPEGQD